MPDFLLLMALLRVTYLARCCMRAAPLIYSTGAAMID